MKPLLSTTAMGLLLCLGYSLPASAEQSKARCYHALRKDGHRPEVH